MQCIETEAVIQKLHSFYEQHPVRSGSCLRLTKPRSENVRNEGKKNKLSELMATYLCEDPDSIAQYIANHVEYTLARSAHSLDDFGAYEATAYSVRDRLIEFWNDTQHHFEEQKTKMCYYMSIEYLLGRSLQNAIMNLELSDNYSEALKRIGFEMEELFVEESDAALGNGGLGRLAACFLDSLATMDYPAWGYGIRYQYGMFKQIIYDGQQIETPDFWLISGNPWEIPRCDIVQHVRLYGSVTVTTNGKGEPKYHWVDGVELLAVPYDTPIPGYGTLNVINLRLWTSRPTSEIDLDYFNQGDYYSAVKLRQQSENITSVLYPNDTTEVGRELRLKQQYFFACATLHDILDRFKRVFPGEPIRKLSEHNAIQLNDTHPSISIPELMRILIDEEDMGWDESWATVTEVFAFTNHTVLPEALEQWPLHMFSVLLPRHIQIIYEINQRFLDGPVAEKWPGDGIKRQNMSIIGHDTVRMAHLAIIGSSFINGVAAIHTEILMHVVFADFYELWPHKFNNKTNGVTPRRWVNQANKPLASLLNNTLESDEWVTNFDSLVKLRKFATNKKFQAKIKAVKFQAKIRLRDEIMKITCGRVCVNAHALFDIHVKRIHEYKRQLLNILAIIHLYLQMKKMTPEELKQVVPRVFVFAGKAAPSYVKAKSIIHLISCVSNIVNEDPEVAGILSIIFFPNYNVSVAEIIIPASDISQHISTAGTEASGTSNMKFAMNAGIILGTLDGANVEMREEMGPENMFIFGAKAEEIEEIRRRAPWPVCEELQEVITSIKEFRWASSDITETQFLPLISDIEAGRDHYLVAYDFPAYIKAQREIAKVWKDQETWYKMAIMSMAGMGKFSADRTISEYAEDIWKVKPCRVPERKQCGECKVDIHYSSK